MKRCLKRWIKRRANEEDLLAKIIICFYKIFVNSSFQTFFNLIVATLLSLFTYYNSIINIPFIITIIPLYLLFLYLFHLANTHRKEKNKNMQLLAECLHECATICHNTKEQVFAQTYKILYENQDKHIIRNDCFFDDASVAACESVYNVLKSIYKNRKFKVIIFKQQKKQDESKFITIIAYKSHENKQPQCSKRQIPIYSQSDSEKLMITKIFEKESPDIVVMAQKDEIEQSFIKINGEKINTKQYLAIPCQTVNGTIPFVLQIGSYIEGLFGDKTDMEYLGNEVLSSYVHTLGLIYEQNLLTKFLSGGKFNVKKQA